MNAKTKEIIELLVKELCKKRKFDFKIEIHYSEDINKDILKYLSREKTINYYKQQDFSKFNGVALPFEDKGYHIVINLKRFSEITTIIHETTHIIDYYEFRNIYNNGNIDIENHPYYWAFSIFSEFNARFAAHKLYLNLDNSNAKDFEIEELTNIINNLYSLKGDLLNKDDYYNLMQYLGRWYSIENICKTHFSLPHYYNIYTLLINYLSNKSETSLALLSSYLN